MAGRNYINHHPLDDPRIARHRRPSSSEVHVMEDQISANNREIQTLLLDNQRLAAAHVALKQDLGAAEQEIRHLSATASAVKAERDAQVREVYERYLKLEAEAMSVGRLPAELERVRAEIKELRAEREGLQEKLEDINGDLARTQAELQEFPDLQAEIEVMRREIIRGRAAIEYERVIRAKNFEMSEVMEKHMASLTHEVDKLRTRLADAEKRAAAAAGAVTAASAVPGYATHHTNIGPGYSGNSSSDSVHQGSFHGTNGLRTGPHVPLDPSNVQGHQRAHS